MNLAYTFTLAIISLSLLAVTAMLCTNPFTLEILKKRTVWIMVAITLAGLMKYPFGGSVFSGLEYEDAFIYNAAARFALNNGAATTVQPFLTASCSNGSLVTCNEYSTYAGHVIGYSSVIAGAAKVFGYGPQLANYVSFSASVICAVVLFIAALLISKSVAFSAIAVFIFDLLPFQNLFATASVVEPFSSLFVLLSLLSYLVCVHFRPQQMQRWRSILSWGGLFLVWWACILIKRENAIAIALLPAVTVALMLVERQPLRALIGKVVPICCIWVALAWFYLAEIDVAATIRAEVPDVGGFPFSIYFLPKLLPVFLATLFDWRLFFVLSALLPLALVKVIRGPGGPSLMWYPIALFFAYLLIYSLHYRSYYFIKTGVVAEFDTYRYLAHLIPLYSLFAAAGFQYCWAAFKNVPSAHARIGKRLTVCIAGIAIVFSAVQTSNLRAYYSEIEDSNRLGAVKSVLHFLQPIDHPYAILTDDVLLFQIFGSSTEFLIDLRVLGHGSGLSDLSELTRRRAVYYVKKPYHDDPIERERYSKEFGSLAKLRMVKCFQDPRGRFELYRLSPAEPV